MSALTPAEINYLQSQSLVRLATIGSDGQPHVVPAGFRYDPEYDTVDIGGHDFARRKKFRDVRRNPHVAFVVDDVASVTSWRVRGIEIRGEAEILETDTFSTSTNYYSAHDVPSQEQKSKRPNT